MNMIDFKKNWEDGKIEKKLYWTIMREKYISILPQFQQLLKDNDECKAIHISEHGCVLEKNNGLKFYFNFSETICRCECDLIMGQDSEKENMNFVVDYLKKHKCSNILDIGANVGIFSMEIYNEIQDICYHVFEPIPSTYECLLRTIQLNNLDNSKYRPYNLGMSDVDGTFDFYLPGASEAASLRPINDEYYLRESDEMGNYTQRNVMQKVKCKVQTVDNFVCQNNITDIGFIKIDVEGNEFNVLKGASNTLKNQKPLVYCELLRKHAKRFGYHPNDVIAYMKSLGYCCKTIRNSGLVDIELIDEQTVETNFFFISNK